MNLANRIEKMKRWRQQSKRNVESADVNQANTVKEKRIRFVSSKYSKSDYAQLTWIEDKWDKFSNFTSSSWLNWWNFHLIKSISNRFERRKLYHSTSDRFSYWYGRL
jgi:dihydropteroate synthase